jgi:hypothetical protein
MNQQLPKVLLHFSFRLSICLCAIAVKTGDNDRGPSPRFRMTPIYSQ